MPRIRWVSPETMHVTLKFYGEIQLDMIESLKKHLSAIKQKGGFIMNVKGINGFPSLAAPNTIWTGVETDEQRLREVFEAVERASLRIGIDRAKRPLKAHITLGRINNGEPLGAAALAVLENNPLTVEPWNVETVTLMQSELFQRGPKYTPLGVFKI